MAEEDDADELHVTGSPCDEIDPAELFESHSGTEAEGNHLYDKGSGSDFDSDREDQVDLLSSENDLSDGFPSLEGFPYGATPPRNVRRQKERFKKGKEKVQALINSPFSREHGSNPSEKAELDRRKKRGSTQLTTERAFQRKLKRGSVDTVSFNVSFDSGVHVPDSAKSLEIPSIKIESTSRFMSLDCVCEDSTDGRSRSNVTGSIPFKQAISRGHPKATRSESDPRSSSSRNYLNPYCPEARMEFYRTFSLLIKLGSLAHKQQENQKQHILGNSVERQSLEENKKWHVELSQALWLELQAWHANRTMNEQDLYLMRARTNVEEVLDEVINFKVKTQDESIQDASNKEGITSQNGIVDHDSMLSSSDDKEVDLTNCQSDIAMPFSDINFPEENETETINFSCTQSSRADSTINLGNEQLTLSEAGDVVKDSVSNETDFRALKSRLHLDLNRTSQRTSSSEEVGGARGCRQAVQDRSCCELKAAIQQVTELFDKVERVENLYPTCKSLGEQNPKYKSKEFSRNFETMCLWLNVTRELYHKLHSIAKFVGVDPADSEIWKDWLDVGLGRLGKKLSIACHKKGGDFYAKEHRTK